MVSRLNSSAGWRVARTRGASGGLTGAGWLCGVGSGAVGRESLHELCRGLLSADGGGGQGTGAASGGSLGLARIIRLLLDPGASGLVVRIGPSLGTQEAHK
jgi:hypothetical protein